MISSNPATSDDHTFGTVFVLRKINLIVKRAIANYCSFFRLDQVVVNLFVDNNNTFQLLI